MSKPWDLCGSVLGLGPLLHQWLQSNPHFCQELETLDPSKHRSTAEVFPLPMLPGDASSCQHSWMEAVVRALNWLAIGDFSLAGGYASPTQQSLLETVQCSLEGMSRLFEQEFDTVPIETYCKSKSVNGYGEEVHCALPISWGNIEHSLPSREVSGILKGVEVGCGGIKDFLVDPFRYLKPPSHRMWMKPASEWEHVASGLLERRICEVIPLKQVLHVDEKPVLGGLFGVPKGEEIGGIPVLRLIMDLRPINSLYELITGDLPTLPLLSQLFPLEIELPEVWRPLLAFGRELPDSLKPPGVSEPCVLTSRVLPMGFMNSVSVAQSLHRSIVNLAVDRFGISRDQEIRKDQPLPSTALAYRVYLDNYDVLERSNAAAAHILSGQEWPLTSELREVYGELDIPINEKKSVKSQFCAEMQGGFVDGQKGLICPKPDKVARYLRGAWYLLQSQRADLKKIQMVAGGFGLSL